MLIPLVCDKGTAAVVIGEELLPLIVSHPGRVDPTLAVVHELQQHNMGAPLVTIVTLVYTGSAFVDLYYVAEPVPHDSMTRI